MNDVKRTAAHLLGVCFLLGLAACSSSGQVERNRKEIDGFLTPKAVAIPDLDARPRSHEGHMRRALLLLHKEGRSDFDLHLARVGFETAARLSRDYWPAWVYAGLVHDMLGNNEQAMNAFAQAAFIDDNAALWNAAAVSALRGGYERLAYSLHRRALVARVQTEDGISRYMESAYTPAGATRPVTRTPAPDTDIADNEKYVCRAIEKDDDDDDDDDDRSSNSLGKMKLDFDFADSGKDKDREEETERLTRDCEQQNVIVDAYIIRRNGESSSSVGIDLLSALQLQFGAQLVDFTYSNPSGSGNSSSSVSGSATVGIPDVTYALSIASDRQNFVTIDATPSVVARLGKKSQIFEGTEVYIIANGDSSSGEFEKEIGVKMSIEPTMLTESAVTLTVGIEFSFLNATTASSANFQTLNTDKLIFDVSGTFPFGAAVLVGKLSSAVVKEGSAGQTGIRSVPGLKNLFGNDDASMTNREVLVLATVRQPTAITAVLESRKADLYERFGVEPPRGEIARYGYIHQAPQLASLVRDLQLDGVPVAP